MQSLYDYTNYENIKESFKIDNFLARCTTSFLHSDNEKESDSFVNDDNYYCKYKIREQERIKINGPEILYKYNIDGFRSKHFQEFNKNHINILFAGCSVTCGEGLPDEFIWTNILTKKIKETNPTTLIDSYNISDPGGNVWQIFHNIKTFIIKYGKPDYLFILYPGFERTIKYEPNGLDFVKVTTASPEDNSFQNSPATRHFMKNYIIEESILLATEFINSIDFLCKMIGIKLIWSTWNGDYFKICEDLESNNYISVYGSYDNLISNIEDLKDHPYFDKARDMHHDGIQRNGQIASSFFKHITKMEYFKNE